jgi:hypothetical protein
MCGVKFVGVINVRLFVSHRKNETIFLEDPIIVVHSSRVLFPTEAQRAVLEVLDTKWGVFGQGALFMGECRAVYPGEAAFVGIQVESAVIILACLILEKRTGQFVAILIQDADSASESLFVGERIGTGGFLLHRYRRNPFINLLAPR